jgi:iron-sulfur cluster repair protein YtfE (RIC family)
MMERLADHTEQTAAHLAATQRYDLYQPIHKGLRDFMGDTLSRVGRVDVFDVEDLARTFAQLEALLNFFVKHLMHENEFLHSAIRARLPAAAARTTDDHREHLQTIESLRLEARAVPATPERERPARALRLYRHLALFVAENLQHMHIEETANNAALWAHYSDAELMAIHKRLLDSIEPADQMETLRWMLPALNPQQRAAVLGDIQAEAPPEVLDAVIGTVRPHLAMRDWSKLARSLGIPAQAGLAPVA